MIEFEEARNPPERALAMLPLAAARWISEGQSLRSVATRLTYKAKAELVARALLAAAELLEDYRREVAINADIIAETRAAAVEECARIADEIEQLWRNATKDEGPKASRVAGDIAILIRALAAQPCPPAQEKDDE